MDDQSVGLDNLDLEFPPFSRGTVQDLTKIVSFMREDEDHVVFKRFERLNLYNLLALQHRLTMLDKDITSHEENQDTHALAKILFRLEHLMKNYNEALLAYEQMGRLQATPQHLTLNLKAHSKHNLIELKHEFDPEAGWAELVSLFSRPKGWIHRFIDRHHQLQKLFSKHGTSHRLSSILIYSEKNVRRAEQALVNFAFCFLVLGPIFALSYITSNIGKLSVVLGSVLITSVLASSLSDREQKSSLAVMVGYTAILVVFLSNNAGKV